MPIAYSKRNWNRLCSSGIYSAVKHKFPGLQIWRFPHKGRLTAHQLEAGRWTWTKVNQSMILMIWHDMIWFIRDGTEIWVPLQPPPRPGARINLSGCPIPSLSDGFLMFSGEILKTKMTGWWINAQSEVCAGSATHLILTLHSLATRFMMIPMISNI